MVTFTDLYAEYGVKSPHDLFEQLREERPLFQVELPNGVPLWLVTQYGDCRAGLGDARLSNRIGTRIVAKDVLPAEIRASMGTHMLRVDGSDHTRLRRLVSSVFTAKRIERLRPMIEEMTSDLLDKMAVQEHPDAIRDLAYPLPMQVICELLGVPVSDHERFRVWSNAYLSGVGTQNFPVDVVTEFVHYVRDLVEQKRAEPDDKLLSAMISARDDEDRLAEHELTSMCFLLIIAGYETTVNLLGNGTALLLADPELADRLRADHEAIPAAVEEFLRFESPVPGASFRVATETMELGGRTIQEGELVLISLLSANRDERVFTDAMTFDAERSPNQHMAFGYGMHYCLGAPLARLEAHIAFRQLLERFPTMEREDPSAELKWRPGLVMRGLTELPVKLTQ
ncbi:cytochrome P450 [Streptomyces sp. IBSBF 2953]|uniref:cytochrome P450 family protein n=1 Tax=Streptomyces TaxID=1883 RepID=UPI00211A24BA|nr:cytochrome P450 [Streptomyces scabiei]MCQ9182384.1 cytochrome P450 [Streptomyces hayashii]MDX3113365.1 cytochrome P450 [Streptomyces scabiei]